MISMPQKIYLHNTLSQKKELFKPKESNIVKLYTCGPTVYNFAHIGNLRTYVFEDLLKRTLQYLGYRVDHVMNLTDIDDKTIKGATEKNQTLEEFTKVYETAFFEDLETLKIDAANHYPKATDHVQSMIEMIEDLLKKEIAYIGHDKSIYFSIGKFKKYGKLSHLKLEDLQCNASNRNANDEYDKENASDFVLWKSYDIKRDGNIFFNSPFGKGRPGWHLECSVMAMKFLGETLDLHMGGVDNIFPHHENEIAQSECFTNKTFCPFWVHAEHLIVDGKKMSKSLGNFYTLKDLLNMGYSGQTIRYLLLSNHYKTQLNFTLEGLKGAKQTLGRISHFIERLQEIDTNIEQGQEVDLEKVQEGFKLALQDDLNISEALAVIFDFIRSTNSLIDQNKISQIMSEKILNMLKNFDLILNVMNFKKEFNSISSELQEALNQREDARKNKDWKLADQLRDFILAHGYLIVDSPKGSTLKKA